MVGSDDDREKLNFPDSEVSSDFIFNFDFTSKGWDVGRIWEGSDNIFFVFLSFTQFFSILRTFF